MAKGTKGRIIQDANSLRDWSVARVMAGTGQRKGSAEKSCGHWDDWDGGWGGEMENTEWRENWMELYRSWDDT